MKCDEDEAGRQMITKIEGITGRYRRRGLGNKNMRIPL